MARNTYEGKITFFNLKKSVVGLLNRKKWGRTVKWVIFSYFGRSLGQWSIPYTSDTRLSLPANRIVTLYFQRL